MQLLQLFLHHYQVHAIELDEIRNCNDEFASESKADIHISCKNTNL